VHEASSKSYACMKGKTCLFEIHFQSIHLPYQSSEENIYHPAPFLVCHVGNVRLTAHHTVVCSEKPCQGWGPPVAEHPPLQPGGLFGEEEVAGPPAADPDVFGSEGPPFWHSKKRGKKWKPSHWDAVQSLRRLESKTCSLLRSSLPKAFACSRTLRSSLPLP
jgi:hypothetical protein